MKKELRNEKKILNISFACSFLFILVEIIVAFYSNSQTLFMDCIYDIFDLIMIGPFILLIPYLYKKETEKHPYGYSQVESLFILIKSTVLIVATCLMVYYNIKLLFNGGNKIDATFLANFQLAVSFICIVIYFILKNKSKDISTPSLDAELYIWKLDAYSTFGVGLAFVIGAICTSLGFTKYIVYLDPMIAIILACILLKEPVGLFLESVNNIILFAPEDKIFNNIKDISTKCLNEKGLLLNFLDIIRTGRKLWIEVYFVSENESININELKELRNKIEDEVKDYYDSIYVCVIPDLDSVSRKNINILRNRRPDKIKYLEKKKKKNINEE